jgi:hypothetical protein
MGATSILRLSERVAADGCRYLWRSAFRGSGSLEHIGPTHRDHQDVLSELLPRRRRKVASQDQRIRGHLSRSHVDRPRMICNVIRCCRVSRGRSGRGTSR